VDFARLDYVALAAGFGVEGIVLDDPSDCRDAYRAALQKRVPVLVEARINGAAYHI